MTSGRNAASGFSPHDQAADDAVFAQQGNGQAGTETEALQHLAHARRVSALFEDIGDWLVHGSLPLDRPLHLPDEVDWHEAR